MTSSEYKFQLDNLAGKGLRGFGEQQYWVTPTARESNLDGKICRRQILTSKVDTAL